MNFSKPKIFNFFDCNFQHFHFYFYLKPHKVKRSTAILFRGSSGVAWHRPGWMGASPAHSGPVPGHGLVQAPPLPEQSPLCAAGPSARFGPAVGSERGGCFSADVIRFFSATSFDQRRAFFLLFVGLFHCPDVFVFLADLWTRKISVQLVRLLHLLRFIFSQSRKGKIATLSADPRMVQRIFS